MSGITGKDALGLFEAYQAVYTTQELTEEQIWEEVENWVNSLLEEGYDLSDYTWEEMYEAYVDEERAPGVKPYKPQPLKPLPQAKPLSGEKGTGEGYGDVSKFKQDTDANKFKPGTSVPKVKKFGRISRAMPAPISGHATKTISANTRTRGEDPGAPTSQKIAKDTRKPRLSREIIRHPKPQAEQVDVYDLILSHLLDEGYASSVDAAEKIMVNMSEQWIETIMIDEGVTLAQYKRKREAYKKSQSGGRSGRVGLGPAGSDARVERDMETRGSSGTGEYGGTTKNPKKLRKQRAMGEID